MFCSLEASAQKVAHRFINFQTKHIQPEDLLNRLNNQGYPYACISLDTVFEYNSQRVFQWIVETGDPIYCDSILCDSKVIHTKTLYRILQFAPGNLYSEKNLKEIPKRMNSASGIRMIYDPDLIYFEKSFQIRIPLERIKKNKIDGIVQVQNDPLKSKSLVTGNLDLELNHLLKRCESFRFLWKRPTANSQYLFASFQLPFAFGLPLGLNVDLQTFLRDSTFAQSQYKVSAYGSVSTENGLSAYLLKYNNVSFQEINGLGNTKSILYGLQFAKKDGNLSSLVPENGYLVQFGGHSGQRKNVATNSNNIIYGYECNGQFQSSKKNMFIQANLKSAGTFGVAFFNNEALRIGGMSSIRGYFEESIPAFHYATLQTNVGRRLGNSFSAYISSDFAQVYAPQFRQLGSFGVGATVLQNNSTVSLSFAWPLEQGVTFQSSNARLGIQFNTYF